jgi:hypothetical protein
MKRVRIINFTGILLIFLLVIDVISYGQSEKKVIDKYLISLPVITHEQNNKSQRYRMIAVYTNRDLYGNFTSKTKVNGDYTGALPGDSAVWSNVYISGSNSFNEAFPQGKKQDYMENFKYIPSPKMLQEEAFKKFPVTPENVFARNLVWDMMALEELSLKYWDSLKLNIPYIVPGIKGEFNMSDIGNYNHNKIEICWKGISQNDNELCAVLDFAAIDNKIEINMAQIKTKGTEQYWGTALVSLKNKNIQHAVMYSGTIQEIEVSSLKDKFLVKTIRELEVCKIQ